MTSYSLYVLPPDAFTTLTGCQPLHDANTPADGTAWKDATGTFTYSRDVIAKIGVNDTDENPHALNDYSNGETTQTLVDPVGCFPAGTPIENEFEITLKATIDGEEKLFRLVALSSGDQIVGYTFNGAWPPEGAELSASWWNVENADNQWTPDHKMLAPCFTRGVMIATPRGDVAIQDLREGDLVLTRDHGAQPIRWIGSAHLDAVALAANDKMQPIRIRAGALGMDLPAQDLIVSPQHRVLVRSKIAAKMFGATEVLAAAKQLLQIDGIDIATDLTEVEYFHMLFDDHQIVISNGAETESLYPGPEALKSVGAAALEEILAIFPELRALQHAPASARPLLSGRQSRKLVVRHAQHARPLVA